MLAHAATRLFAGSLSESAASSSHQPESPPRGPAKSSSDPLAFAVLPRSPLSQSAGSDFFDINLEGARQGAGAQAATPHFPPISSDGDDDDEDDGDAEEEEEEDEEKASRRASGSELALVEMRPHAASHSVPDARAMYWPRTSFTRSDMAASAATRSSLANVRQSRGAAAGGSRPLPPPALGAERRRVSANGAARIHSLRSAANAAAEGQPPSEL